MTLAVSNRDRQCGANAELPEGWALVRICELYDSWGGATPSRSNSHYWGPGVPWITSRELRDGWVDEGTQSVSDLALAETRLRRCLPGTVLVVVRSGVLANRLPIAITRRSVVINQDWKAFTAPNRRLNPWLALALRAVSSTILEENRRDGTTVQSVKFDQLKQLRIPLPPMVEQERIVAATERLTSRINAARDRLTRVPKILKRFRQTVLAAACSGRLTEDWREAHPDTPSVVEQLAEFDSGHARPRSTCVRTGDAKSEPTLELDGLPDLPSTWCYRRADSIVDPATAISYGIVLPGPEVVRGIPYVRQRDVIDGTVLVDQLRKTTSEIAAKHQRSTLAAGGVLLCIIRHLRVAIVPSGIDGANLTQGTVRLRPSLVASGPYLAMYLGGVYAQNWMRQRHFGMSMPRINVRDARAVPVAVPPVGEQTEIVRRVQPLMKLADAIERRVVVATARADKITQAVLAKAFRGELVPTEAELARDEGRTYETAAELLARIVPVAKPAAPPKRRKRRVGP